MPYLRRVFDQHTSFGFFQNRHNLAFSLSFAHRKTPFVLAKEILRVICIILRGSYSLYVPKCGRCFVRRRAVKIHYLCAFIIIKSQ